jgi:hypothetical protein
MLQRRFVLISAFVITLSTVLIVFGWKDNPSLVPPTFAWSDVRTKDATDGTRLILSEPLMRAVYQRDAHDIAIVPIAGTYRGEFTEIRARYYSEGSVSTYAR